MDTTFSLANTLNCLTLHKRDTFSWNFYNISPKKTMQLTLWYRNQLRGTDEYGTSINKAEYSIFIINRVVYSSQLADISV